MSKNFLYASSSLALAGTVIGAWLTPAFAQQTAQVGLEEITVTARRQEESLMQVPLAISAVTSSEIESAGIRDIKDLGKFTPGLFASTSGNGRTDRFSAKLTFRGFSVRGGQTFVDGAPFAGASTAPDISDVQRVEVLKGPQSVYFGRATYSGAVNYVLREPGDKFAGRVSADIYSYGSSDITASLEAPIAGDKLSMRVSGRRYYTAGQYKNPLGGDRLGQEETDSFKVYALSKPTDQLKISGLYSWSLEEDGTPTQAVMLQRKYSGGPTSQPTGGELQCNLGGTGGAYYCGQLPNMKTLHDVNPLIISVDDLISPVVQWRIINNQPVLQPQLNILQSYPLSFSPTWLQHFGFKRLINSGHLKLDYETEGGWALSAATVFDRIKQEQISDQNYRDTRQLINPNYNANNLPVGGLDPYDSHPLLNALAVTKDFSQEARISSPTHARLRGVLGVSYYYQYTPLSGITGYGISATVSNASSLSKVKTPAVFGAAYFDIMQDLTLTAEARYQWDGITQQQRFPIVTQLLQNTFKSFSPRVSLDYKYAENSLAYALFSRGYQPGGFNTALIGVTPEILAQLSSAGGKLAYDQERLDNFEIGLKSTWFENRLQTTLAGYYDKWTHGQNSQTFFTTAPNGSLIGQFSITANAGQVNLSGIEAEARWAATEHLQVQASLGWTHNKIINFAYLPDGPKIMTGGQNINGHRLSQSPEWTWSLSPQYTSHLGGDWDWFARVDWTYRGKYFIDNTNVAWVAPLSLVNLHAGIKKENFSLEAYVKNALSNNQIPEAVAGSCCSDIIGNQTALSAIRIGVPQKLTLGIKGSYNF